MEEIKKYANKIIEKCHRAVLSNASRTLESIEILAESIVSATGQKRSEPPKCELDENGECCCTCHWKVKLMCHPWNERFGKGRISEACGWACTNPGSDLSSKGMVVFMDREHGRCELYRERIG